MKKQILDTNVLLRFLVGDNEKQQKEAHRWFQEAEQRKRKIVVVPLVVAETCFVLESFYKKQREEIAETLEVFLAQRWLEVEERNVLLSLWFWYRKGFHFVDSFLLAWTQTYAGDILTFDRALSKKAS
ncbi:MAG: PIN domain-containing protein [bacterium]|nr:PIN domain-containing protein [bacterium]